MLTAAVMGMALVMPGVSVIAPPVAGPHQVVFVVPPVTTAAPAPPSNNPPPGAAPATPVGPGITSNGALQQPGFTPGQSPTGLAAATAASGNLSPTAPVPFPTTPRGPTTSQVVPVAVGAGAPEDQGAPAGPGGAVVLTPGLLLPQAVPGWPAVPLVAGSTLTPGVPPLVTPAQP